MGAGCGCGKSGGCSNGKARREDEVKPAPTVHLIEMVAHRTLHGEGETPWRCRICDEMGEYSGQGIIDHLKEIHGIAIETLEVGHAEGQVFAPAGNVQAAA